MAEPRTALTPGAGVRTRRGVRVGIADQDSGFVRALVNRLPAVSMEPVLLTETAAASLIPLRLAALVLDPPAIGNELWSTLQHLRERLPSLALVVCTPRSSVGERVRALRMGVDAWVTKPCHPEELAYVVCAVLRRNGRCQLHPLEESIFAGELTIRPDRHQAYVGERSVHLTAREFALLLLLASNDRVLEREEIYERVWGYAMAHGDRSVDVFIRKVRFKLHAASPAWSYIHTHFGIGYRFCPESHEQTPASVLPSAGQQHRDDRARVLCTPR